MADKWILLALGIILCTYKGYAPQLNIVIYAGLNCVFVALWKFIKEK